MGLTGRSVGRGALDAGLAVTPAAGLPEGFESVRPSKTLYLAPEEAEALRGPAIERWRAALAQ